MNGREGECLCLEELRGKGKKERKRKKRKKEERREGERKRGMANGEQK